MQVRGAGISPDQEIFQDWTDPGEVFNRGHFSFRQIAYDEGVVGAYDNVRLVDLSEE
jgi:hypothetical protein